MRKNWHHKARGDMRLNSSVTVADHVASDAEEHFKILLPTDIHTTAQPEMITDGYTEVSSGLCVINFNSA